MSLITKPKAWHWTAHARFKMKFYGLSEARVRRIVNSPKRIEEGIAPETVAMMQIAGNAKHPFELWTMIQEEKKRRKVISAWRYPGITKPKDHVIQLTLQQEYKESKE